MELGQCFWLLYAPVNFKEIANDDIMQATIALPVVAGSEAEAARAGECTHLSGTYLFVGVQATGGFDQLPRLANGGG